MSDFVRIDKYTVAKLEDSGQYGFKIIEGWEGRDGSFKPNFCDREFKKDSGKKTVPVSVKLGDKPTAIATLKIWLRELEGGSGDHAPAEDQDVPF